MTKWAWHKERKTWSGLNRQRKTKSKTIKIPKITKIISKIKAKH